MDELARRMQASVKATPRRRKAADTAVAKLRAIGIAYLEFAMQETGLFNTAFALPRHMEYAVKGGGDEAGPTPFQLLSAALDELVTAGVLPEVRRPHAEYPVWASVRVGGDERTRIPGAHSTGRPLVKEGVLKRSR